MGWFTQKKPAGSSEDADLLRRVAEGDRIACRHLSQQHLGRITTFARRMLNDPFEAEDVAQEAFFKLWSQAGSWRAEARIDTWLHRVTHNLCVDRLRKNRESLPGELPEMIDETPTPLEQHQQKQVSQWVENALEALPERQRAAIVLFHYQDISVQDAADILGVSLDAMESLLTRGRRGLKQSLQGRRNALLGEEE